MALPISSGNQGSLENIHHTLSAWRALTATVNSLPDSCTSSAIFRISANEKGLGKQAKAFRRCKYDLRQVLGAHVLVATQQLTIILSAITRIYGTNDLIFRILGSNTRIDITKN